MPGEQKRAFIEKLNAFVRSRGARLYVKLHPHSYLYAYSDSYLPRTTTSSMAATSAPAPLLRRAKGCFGILSTLVAVAV